MVKKIPDLPTIEKGPLAEPKEEQEKTGEPAEIGTAPPTFSPDKFTQEMADIEKQEEYLQGLLEKETNQNNIAAIKDALQKLSSSRLQYEPFTPAGTAGQQTLNIQIKKGSCVIWELRDSIAGATGKRPEEGLADKLFYQALLADNPGLKTKSGDWNLVYPDEKISFQLGEKTREWLKENKLESLVGTPVTKPEPEAEEPKYGEPPTIREPEPETPLPEKPEEIRPAPGEPVTGEPPLTREPEIEAPLPEKPEEVKPAPIEPITDESPSTREPEEFSLPEEAEEGEELELTPAPPEAPLPSESSQPQEKGTSQYPYRGLTGNEFLTKFGDAAKKPQETFDYFYQNDFFTKEDALAFSGKGSEELKKLGKRGAFQSEILNVNDKGRDALLRSADHIDHYFATYIQREGGSKSLRSGDIRVQWKDEMSKLQTLDWQEVKKVGDLSTLSPQEVIDKYGDKLGRNETTAYLMGKDLLTQEEILNPNLIGRENMGETKNALKFRLAQAQTPEDYQKLVKVLEKKGDALFDQYSDNYVGRAPWRILTFPVNGVIDAIKYPSKENVFWGVFDVVTLIPLTAVGKVVGQPLAKGGAKLATKAAESIGKKAAATVAERAAEEVAGRGVAEVAETAGREAVKTAAKATSKEVAGGAARQAGEEVVEKGTVQVAEEATEAGAKAGQKSLLERLAEALRGPKQVQPAVQGPAVQASEEVAAAKAAVPKVAVPAKNFGAKWVGEAGGKGVLVEIPGFSGSTYVPEAVLANPQAYRTWYDDVLRGFLKDRAAAAGVTDLKPYSGGALDNIVKAEWANLSPQTKTAINELYALGQLSPDELAQLAGKEGALKNLDGVARRKVAEQAKIAQQQAQAVQREAAGMAKEEAGRGRPAAQVVKSAKKAEVKVGAVSDQGLVRTLNEDFFAVPEHFNISPEIQAARGRFYVAADGMGGHQAGDVASREAVNTAFTNYYSSPSFDQPASALRRVYGDVNETIYEMAARDPSKKGMGTTMTSAVVRGNEATIAHVGDSRAYLINQKGITQLTSDHSWVQDMVRQGVLTPEQARTHPYRNVITKAIGANPSVSPDIFTQTLGQGDNLLLATDGLTGKVTDAEIWQTVLRLKDPQKATQALIDLAKGRGGEDNITALLISS